MFLAQCLVVVALLASATLPLVSSGPVPPATYMMTYDSSEVMTPGSLWHNAFSKGLNRSDF